MYKQTNTIFKPKRIRLFALIINCTILMKTNSRFSRSVYTISDRIWCNKHLRHTTTEKYENNGKGGYLRFDNIRQYPKPCIRHCHYLPPGSLHAPGASGSLSHSHVSFRVPTGSGEPWKIKIFGRVLESHGTMKICQKSWKNHGTLKMSYQ